MDVVNCIVGKMLEPIIDLLFKSIWRQIGYLVHYKKNIKNFEDEVEKLGDWMGRVQEDVNLALDNGMVVEEDVSKWLEKVPNTLMKIKEEVKKLSKDKENLCGLDLCSRYRLGRQGKKKMMVVTSLKDKCKFDRVAHRARLNNVWYTHTTDYENFESRKSLFKEIMDALKDDKNYKIGIYGMPGVGKTTLVEEVGKHAGKFLFDEVAMAVFSHNSDLKNIQGKLADCLNLTLIKESEEGRAGELCNRLNNGRKILVILDDVWGDQITLKKIGIPDIDNSMGCKILLTSRRLEVCKQMGFKKNFEIELLLELEAWQLFKRTVGDFIEDDHEMLSVAREVCRECDCLPLAILAIGATLKDEKEKHAWDDALEQLRNFHGDKIEGVTEKLYSHIEWSYNYLKQTDVQSCFLHCCLFPEDAEIFIDDLMSYGVGTKFLESIDRTSMKKARDRTHVMVGILKKSYLLLEGMDKNWVKMHDVIRDVAISIASKDPNAFLVKDGVEVWPEKDEYKCCRAISLRTSYNVRQIPDQLDCRGLRTLVLGYNTNILLLELPSSFFKGMEQLEVLDLFRIKILPSSLSNLISLRMLRLRNCEFVDLSFPKELENLEILTIVGGGRSRVMVLEIGLLTRLRLFNLGHSIDNTILPLGVLSSLPNLEELYLSVQFVAWQVEGNTSIVELNSLTSLTALENYIPLHDILRPNVPSFKSLTRYKIWIVAGTQKHFKWDKYHLETKILGLVGVALKVELNFLMENAEVLHLFALKGLKKVLHDRDGEWFLDLNYLQVKYCYDMEHLLGKPNWSSQTQRPCPSGSFAKLSVLKVENCKLMKYLFSPSTARGLPKLQKLEVKKCETLEEIVGGDVVMDKVIFHQLKTMRLLSLPTLRSIYTNTKKTSTTECSPSTIKQALFNEKVTFPVLERVYIEELNSITAIWDKQLLPIQQAEDSFEHLKELTVVGCKEMEGIVAFEVGQGVEEANDEIFVFPQLKTMELRNLPNLKSFCCSCGFGKEQTSEEDILPLQAFFNYKVKFPNLENLHIESIDNLKEIWHITVPTDSVWKLRELTVKLCDGLLNIAQSKLYGSFQNLERLNIGVCPSLEEVFKAEGLNAAEGIAARDKAEGYEGENNPVFCQLKIVELCNLPRLTSFYLRSCVSEFPSLVTLRITSCSVLEMFPHSRQYPNTARLRTIDGPLQPHSNEKVAFPILEELQLSDGSLFGDILNGHIPATSFSKVRALEVVLCKELTNVPALLQRFEAVEELNLILCSSLQQVALFNHEGLHAIERKGFLVLNNLTKLQIGVCNSVKYLFSLSIAKGLKQLRRLEIRSCHEIKEIVRNEEQGPEDARDEIIIVFPGLEFLHLQWLDKLESFCRPNNISFQLPSLNQVIIKGCPSRTLETSFFGDGLDTSLMEALIDWQKWQYEEDINCKFEWQRPRVHDDDDQINVDENDLPLTQFSQIYRVLYD